MPRTFVALDLETTGISAERDAIIEVGAVRMRDGEVVDQYSTFVNPGRPIPYEITMLTGIVDGDVMRAPKFDQVADPLSRFVGGSPVVGHNVAFDLGFVRARGLLLENQGLDTWELASILLPSLPSYSLGALSVRFDVASPNRHRAPDDALATGRLFEALCALAAKLPRAVLAEIGRLAHDSDWALRQVFLDALEASGPRTARGEMSLEQLAPQSPLFNPWAMAEPLAPNGKPETVNEDELARILMPGGAVSQSFPGFEYRPPQVDLMRAILGAFNVGHHLLAEAGTGTGKSLAYLLPAIAYARKNGTRVVVSTNTINLQDQLYKKDLPDLQQVLGHAWGSEAPFRAALLKGRSNYLCPRRFAALKGRPGLSHEELRGITRVLVWLPQTQSGDQSELSLPLPADRFVWSQMSAANEGCSLERCQREMGGRCFFYRARKSAEAAHVIVVNHALLMADAATENRVLPEYHHLIVDEAHHLEDAVTDQLSFKADRFSIDQLFNQLHPDGGRAGRQETGGRGSRGTGLLAEVLAASRPLLDQGRHAIIRDAVLRLQGDVQAVQSRLASFWDAMEDLVRELAPRAEASEYDLRLRITPGTRSQSAWVPIEVAWDNLSLLWSGLLNRLEELRRTLTDLQTAADDPQSIESLVEEIDTVSRNLGELQGQMETWVMKPAENSVYWTEVTTPERGGRRIILRAAPLHVGPLVQDNVFFKNETVVLTSATLRTAGSFDYVRDRLAAQDADTATVGSPFDYKESTLLYLPTDLPEPNAPGFQTAVEQSLIGLAKVLGGRTLALFTSYSQLRRTGQAIVPQLTEAGITVLSQGSGGSRHQLLETFKASPRTVLLGTRSFWEGVDVIGPALSALMLVRLPFAVPSDPVVAARSETFEDPFYNYQVPDAILRFRQGFGRLIRSKSDRGVVLVMDKRVTSKGYGQLFLDSLPECTVHKGPLMNLAAAAKAWVDRPNGDG